MTLLRKFKLIFMWERKNKNYNNISLNFWYVSIGLEKL